MKANIVKRNWVVEWFDERMCFHMPSLTMANDGTLLTVWNGGFMQWNDDPRAATLTIGVHPEPGSDKWSNPRRSAATCATPAMTLFSSRTGRGRSSSFTPSSWTPRSTSPTGATDATSSGPANLRRRPHLAVRQTLRHHPPATPPTTASSCPDGTMVFASTSSEIPGQIFRRRADLHLFTTEKPGEAGPCSTPSDGNLIRSPPQCYRPDGTIRMFTVPVPAMAGWGTAGNCSLPLYTAEVGTAAA